MTLNVKQSAENGEAVEDNRRHHDDEEVDSLPSTSSATTSDENENVASLSSNSIPPAKCRGLKRSTTNVNQLSKGYLSPERHSSNDGSFPPFFRAFSTPDNLHKSIDLVPSVSVTPNHSPSDERDVCIVNDKACASSFIGRTIKFASSRFPSRRKKKKSKLNKIGGIGTKDFAHSTPISKTHQGTEFTDSETLTNAFTFPAPNILNTKSDQNLSKNETSHADDVHLSISPSNTLKKSSDDDVVFRRPDQVFEAFTKNLPDNYRRQSLAITPVAYSQSLSTTTSASVTRQTLAAPIFLSQKDDKRIRKSVADLFELNRTADKSDFNQKEGKKEVPLTNQRSLSISTPFIGRTEPNCSMTTHISEADCMTQSSELCAEVEIAIDEKTDNEQQQQQRSVVHLRDKASTNFVGKSGGFATSRALSAYLPPLSSLGFFPGTSKPSKKIDEQKEKSKTKKHGFFHQRPRSKEKKPHFWIKVTPTSNDRCEICSQKVSNPDAYQCNGCQTLAHGLCKDQLKMRCRKPSKVKNNPTFVLHHADVANQIVEPLDQKIFRLQDNNDDNQLNQSTVNEKNSDDNSNESKFCQDIQNSHPDRCPAGFLAFTSLDTEWDQVDLWAEEPEPWSDTIGKTAKKTLSSKEVKKQNAIYDLYITEKHHCQTLVVLKHTYFGALISKNILPQELSLLSPHLDSLLSVHLDFLCSLRQRKLNSVVFEAVHDIILSHFTNNLAGRMIDAYIHFCSQKDAADRMYNFLSKESSQFKNIISEINSTGFYKTLSLPGCLLRITQRLSKYHQFVESLVKHTSDAAEKEEMLKAEKAVKDLITAVDSGIDRIQMNQMKDNIARHTDPKSTVLYDKERNQCFTQKDLISDTRQLVYFCEVQWFNAKRNPANVILLLFNDFVVFMQKTSGGYFHFFGQDNKCCVISLRKLIVRDKAGKYGSDGIYLIAQFPRPEMYEIKCKTKKENQALINRIQKAVDLCANTDDQNVAEQYVAGGPQEPVLPEIKEEDLATLLTNFDKFHDVNQKLREYFDGAHQIYTEISNMVMCLVPSIRNLDERNKLTDLADKGFSKQDEFLRAIAVAYSLQQFYHIQSSLFLSLNNKTLCSTNGSTNSSSSSAVVMANDSATHHHTTATSTDGSTASSTTTPPSKSSGSYRTVKEQSCNGNSVTAGGQDDAKSVASSLASGDAAVDSNPNVTMTTTTSLIDSQIGRSNTFHYVRVSDRRRGLRKHATVAGASGVEAKNALLKTGLPTNYEDSMTSASTDDDAKTLTDSEILKQLGYTQVALNELQQQNTRLQCELAAYRSMFQQQQQHQSDTNTEIIHGRHSLPSSSCAPQHLDNYAILEELRRLHTDLDNRKAEFAQFISDHQFEMSRRERILAERQSYLDRDDADLRARWAHLYQVWETQRLMGAQLMSMPQLPPYITSSQRVFHQKHHYRPPNERRQSGGKSSDEQPRETSTGDFPPINEGLPLDQQQCRSGAAFSPPSVQPVSNDDSSIVGGGAVKFVQQEQSMVNQQTPIGNRPASFCYVGPTSGPVPLQGQPAGLSPVYHVRSASNPRDIPPALQGSLVHRVNLSASSPLRAYSSSSAIIDASSVRHLASPPRSILPTKLSSGTTTTTSTSMRHQISPPTIMVPANLPQFMTDTSAMSTGGGVTSSLASRFVNPLTRYGSTKKLKYSPSKITVVAGQQQQTTPTQQQSSGVGGGGSGRPLQIIPSKLATAKKPK